MGRIVLTLDMDDPQEIEDFLRFVAYHSKRLRCTTDKVFIELAKEYRAQEKEGLLGIEPRNDTTRARKAKAETGTAEA